MFAFFLSLVAINKRGKLPGKGCLGSCPVTPTIDDTIYAIQPFDCSTHLYPQDLHGHYCQCLERLEIGLVSRADLPCVLSRAGC